MLSGSIIISTILKHDSKVTSYKIALLRAINDIVLSFPDLRNYHQDVAIPLKLLAQFWVAYYWPFVKPDSPIYQGQRATLNGQLRNDMAFRPELTKLRNEWENIVGSSHPSDGFYLINELRIPRKRQTYPPSLYDCYAAALSAIAKAIEMPIRHAGPSGSNWTVFSKPLKYADIDGKIIAIPGTKSQDKCLIINAELWQTFQEMSLWIEALCIHEWCLFSEQVKQENQVHRGLIYQLLTYRPDNRRPLTWERNNIDILLMEGTKFRCPWTEKTISQGINYDLDHILPVSLYPINELWNLVPSDPEFNSYQKRDRLPSIETLQKARPYFELAYSNYNKSLSLSKALQEDVAVRFSTVFGNVDLPIMLSTAVVNLIDSFGEYRNLARF